MSLKGVEIGVCVRAADGFAVSGDSAIAREQDGTLVFAIIDALGHGPAAHDVAVLAEELIEHSALREVSGLLAMLDRELAATMGAAAGIATVDAETGAGEYAGIGNTVARILGRTERRFVSVDGIVGKTHGPVRAATFTLAHGDSLLMHTDGISSRIRVAEYPGMLTDAAEDAAREIVRRFGREHDDAACIVMRLAP